MLKTTVVGIAIAAVATAAGTVLALEDAPAASATTSSAATVLRADFPPLP